MTKLSRGRAPTLAATPRPSTTAAKLWGASHPGTGGYDAAIWENGTVTDLNTRYASILPAGFTLNNATAIDNGGDIAGFGTDSRTNTVRRS